MHNLALWAWPKFLFNPLKVPKAAEKQIVHALFGVKPSTVELKIN